MGTVIKQSSSVCYRIAQSLHEQAMIRRQMSAISNHEYCALHLEQSLIAYHREQRWDGEQITLYEVGPPLHKS